MSTQLVQSNKMQTDETAVGDNVMAELQNRLRDRGKSEPTHTKENIDSPKSVARKPFSVVATSPIDSKSVKLTRRTIDTNGPNEESSNNSYTTTVSVKNSISSPNKVMFRRVTSPASNNIKTPQQGVRELARIFSARSKEATTPTGDKKPDTKLSTKVTSLSTITTSNTSTTASSKTSSTSTTASSKTSSTSTTASSKTSNISTTASSKTSNTSTTASSKTSSTSTTASSKTSSTSTTASSKTITTASNKTSSTSTTASNKTTTTASNKTSTSSDETSSDNVIISQTDNNLESFSKESDNKHTLDSNSKKYNTHNDTNNEIPQTYNTECHHHYQNVFDDDKYLIHPKPKLTGDKVAKRPMPIPRKLSPMRQEVNQEVKQEVQKEKKQEVDKEDLELYEEMAPVNSLQDLHTEITLLENVLNVPSLSDKVSQHKKLSKSQSQQPHIAKRSTQKLQKELRKGVVTDIDSASSQEEEYILMGPPTSEHLSSGSGYLRLLDNKNSEDAYMTMRHPSLSADSKPLHSTEVQLNNWKRSQGSIFAQEMIHFIDEQETTYCHVNTNECRIRTGTMSDDSGSEKYIDVGLRAPPISQMLLPSGRMLPPPVPNRPLTGPAAPNPEATIFNSKILKPKDTESSQMATPLLVPNLLPPILPPKSESMLREQQGVYPTKKEIVGKSKSEKKRLKLKLSGTGSSDETVSTTNNAKDLIRALKKQTLSTTESNAIKLLPLDYTSLDSGRIDRSPSSPNLLGDPVNNKCFERKGVVIKRKHKQKLTSKINRQSLTVILQNREMITEHLKLQGHIEDDDNQSPKKGKETLIRSLGEILLEISELVESNEIEQTNLVETIENHLHIKLNSAKATPKLPLEDKHTTITDEVVDDVVKYIDDKCTLEDSNENINHQHSIIRNRPSLLRRTVSEAMLVDAVKLNRSNSVTSLHSQGYRTSDDNDDDDDHLITQSVTVATEVLARGPSLRRNTASSDATCSTSCAANGVGYFTSIGGTLTNRNSGIVIEIPPGAVMKGRRQKISFNVLQTVHKEDADPQTVLLVSNGASKIDLSNKGKVQLSPIVCIGPPDLMLRKPIKINIPHCVPIDCNSWNLKVQGRGHNTSSDEWISLSPSAAGRFIPAVPVHNKKSFKNSTYQLHPTNAYIKTKLPGFFRLVGKAASQNSAYKTVKKMVCSIYYMQQNDGSGKIKVFFVNAILDSVEALDEYLISDGYKCIDRNIPLTCYGNQTDLTVSLTVDTTKGHIPLYSQTVPFVVFWKATRIGSARVTFELDNAILNITKLLTLRFGQIDNEPLDVEFILP